MPSLETFKPSQNETPAAVILWSVDRVGAAAASFVSSWLPIHYWAAVMEAEAAKCCRKSMSYVSVSPSVATSHPKLR